MKDVEAMAAVVDPTVETKVLNDMFWKSRKGADVHAKSQPGGRDRMRNNIFAAVGWDGRTNTAVEHAAHESSSTFPVRVRWAEVRTDHWLGTRSPSSCTRK